MWYLSLIYTIPNPFSLVRGLLRRLMHRFSQSTPARHHGDLLTVVHIFFTAIGVWHIYADSSRHPPSVPPLTLRGISLTTLFSFLGVFFCELVAWWDVARGLLVPSLGSAAFWALCWLAGNSLQSKPTAHHLMYILSIFVAASSVLQHELQHLRRWQKGSMY